MLFKEIQILKQKLEDEQQNNNALMLSEKQNDK